MLIAAFNILAQMPKVTVPPAQPTAQQQMPVPTPIPEDNTLYYLLLLVLVGGLVGAIIWMLKSRKAREITKGVNKNDAMNQFGWDDTSLDADKELEWLRKNKKIINKRGGGNGLGKRMPKGMRTNRFV